MRNVRQAFSDNVSTLILIFTHFAFFSIHFTFHFHYNCYASILRAARPLRGKIFFENIERDKILLKGEIFVSMNGKKIRNFRWNREGRREKGGKENVIRHLMSHQLWERIPYTLINVSNDAADLYPPQRWWNDNVDAAHTTTIFSWEEWDEGHRNTTCCGIWNLCGTC